MTISSESEEQQPSSIATFAARAFVSVLILLIAGAIAFYFVFNPKISEKDEQDKDVTVFVETQVFDKGSYPVVIQAMGRIVPAREVLLKAQVSGEVLSVSDAFIPGGYFAEGAPILNIDPSDYELNVKAQEAVLQQAQAALRLEKGQQAIARDELKILERTTGRKLANKDLALRRPQLEQARADIASAQASLDIAKLNLERTALKAPFNSIVTVRNTNVGNVINTGEHLATLVDVDEYWIEAEIPVHDLRWINTSDHRYHADILEPRSPRKRTGYVKRITGIVDENSRLARVLVGVADPLLRLNNDNADTAFILNLYDFVRLKITGNTLHNIYRLPQNLVRDGDVVWIYNDGKLDILPVNIVREDREYTYIDTQIAPHAAIITSDLLTPIHGMDISLRHHDEGQ